MSKLLAVVVILVAGAPAPREQAGAPSAVITARSVAAASRPVAHMSPRCKAWFSQAVEHILRGD